jgi:predicted esterase
MRQAFGLARVAFLALSLAACQQQQPSTTAPAEAAPPAPPPIPIPKVAGTISDWTAQAHQVQVLVPADAKVVAKVQLKVAWTPSVLLLQVHTDDATPFETANDPWANDSVEVFLASPFGSDDHVRFICTPGRTHTPFAPAWHAYDGWAATSVLAAPQLHTEKEGDGYTMTISVPWLDLKQVPRAGDVIGLQVYVNDAQGNGVVSRRLWYPVPGASDHPQLMQRVQLADNAGTPEDAAAWLQVKGFSETAHVTTVTQDAGKKIELWSGAQLVGSGELTAGGPDGASGSIPLPAEIAKQKGDDLMVTVNGRPLAYSLTIPDLAAHRRDLIKDLPLNADNAIFDGTSFPNIDFRNQEVVEAAIGAYSLHTRFFDANWNEVTAPSAPGRYGARVEFKSADGEISFIKRLPLFHTAQPYMQAKDPYAATVKFPAAFGLPDAALAREQWNINNRTGGTLEGVSRLSADWAILVAGLSDLARDPDKLHGFSVWKINHDWWSELEKRLGENQDYPHLTYLPDGYDKDKRTWPLIVFLHGSGERGSDLTVLEKEGPLGYIKSGHALPFIVVNPLCPEDEDWNAARLARLLDQLEVTYRIDPKRIYVTGLSMGGFGSLDFAATYPDRIAAIAPVSGGEDPDLAERLKKMPTWFFHGGDDPVVPTTFSVNLEHAMQKLNAPVKLTVYPGVGHGDWDKTYSDPQLYTWLLQHTK